MITLIIILVATSLVILGYVMFAKAMYQIAKQNYEEKIVGLEIAIKTWPTTFKSYQDIVEMFKEITDNDLNPRRTRSLYKRFLKKYVNI